MRTRFAPPPAPDACPKGAYMRRCRDGMTKARRHHVGGPIGCTVLPHGRLEGPTDQVEA